MLCRRCRMAAPFLHKGSVSGPGLSYQAEFCIPAAEERTGSIRIGYQVWEVNIGL